MALYRRIYILWVFLLFGVKDSVLQASPSKTVIAFDFDYVLAEIKHWRVLSGVAYYLSSNPSFLWQSLCPGYELNKVLSQVYTIHTSGKGTDTTYNLIDIAHAYPSFKRYFDDYFRFMQASINPIKDILEVCRSLKKQGYTLIIATNRDRIAFELAWEVLGSHGMCDNNKPLFDFVITTKPVGREFVSETICAETKQRFSQLAPQSLYDGWIREIPAYKPDHAYYKMLADHVYEYMQSQGKTEQYKIVFFDDKRANVYGARYSNQGIAAFHVPSERRAKSVRACLHSIGIFV